MVSKSLSWQGQQFKVVIVRQNYPCTVMTVLYHYLLKGRFTVDKSLLGYDGISCD